MDRLTGRPNHIEDYLVQLHGGQWFGWSDSKNKVYANLELLPKWHTSEIKDNPFSLPSELDCTNGLKAIQDAWDSKNN